MEKLLSGFGKINANAIWSLIAVAFSGAIIAGLAFIGLRMMMHAQDDLTIHRTIGSISNQETYRIIGMISGGSVCLAWSLFLAIRVITVAASWFNDVEKRGVLPSRVIRNLYPLFTFAGMVFLALVAYSCYYTAATGAIPTFVRGADPYNYPWAYSGELDMAMGLPFIGTAALTGAGYLALRLIANVVKSSLKNDGAYSQTAKHGREENS